MTPLERFYSRLENAPISDNDISLSGFLTHRVDAFALLGAARALAEQLPAADVLLTVESSGIAPAFALAQALELPFVYAKRDKTGLSGEIKQIMLGDDTVFVANDVIREDSRVLIVDDILEQGFKALALARLAVECGARTVGVVTIIERTFDGGRNRLEMEGIPVFSLVQLASNGEKVFLERRGLRF
jgi:xanthine phosphoribosyltransferase